MNISSFSRIRDLGVAVFIITATSIFAYRLVFYPQAATLPFLGLLIGAIFILWKPIIGLAAYLLIYPMVPQGESVNLLKTSMLGLNVILLFIWVWQKITVRENVMANPAYRWMIFFFIFLCFSPFLGRISGFSVMDWARDIAPFLNLLLIPFLVEFLNDKKNRWLWYLVFVPITFGLLRDILFLLGRYGVPAPTFMNYYPIRLSTFHPAMIFILGVMFLAQKAPQRVWWSVNTAAALAVIALTPTRTVWFSLPFTLALLFTFYQRFRRLALAAIGLMIIIMGWLVFVPGNPYSTFKSYGTGGSYVQMQSARIFGIQHQDVAILNRADETKVVMEKFKGSPLYGVGFGFKYVFWRHHVSGKGGSGFYENNFTHNDVANILAKGGLAGLLLFMVMLSKYLKALYRKRKRVQDPIRMVLPTAAVIGIFSSIFVGLSTPVYQTREAIFFLVFLVALGLSDIDVKSLSPRNLDEFVEG